MDIRILVGLLHTLEELRSHERWTRTELAEYQASSLKHLRNYVYAHSPFYKEFHRGLYDAPISELPVLSKAEMMAHFDDLVTEPRIHLTELQAYINAARSNEHFLGDYWVNTTSGSTGRPGIFLFNRSEWTTIIASFARSYEWGGIRVNLTKRRKMAVVASTNTWHMSALVGATVQSWWSPTLRISATEPLEKIVQQLNDWQPEVLVAYASMAKILAAEQLGGFLHIRPKVVFTSSEVLTEEARRQIEAAWGKVLFNQYAATESGGIAAECDAHHGMHLFEDLLIVEPVDLENRPVPVGEFAAKLLITSLTNRTQPLIRYELNDSVQLATTVCSSKRPFALVEGVQGRTEDILHFPDRNGKQTAVHPNLFHQVMDTVAVGSWQIIQEKNALTVLLTDAQNGFSTETLRTKLGSALSQQNIDLEAIHVQRVSSIPKSASGKQPLIKAHTSSL